jgi:hypothetical protein
MSGANEAGASGLIATRLEGGGVLRLVAGRSRGSILDGAPRQALGAARGEPPDRSERACLARMLPSRDTIEGQRAFLARRPPQWQDA